MKDIRKKLRRNPWPVYAIFVAIGLLMIVAGSRVWLGARASGHWPTTDGVIISSTIQEHRHENRYEGAYLTYSAEVNYQYLVNGMPYSSDLLSFSGLSSQSLEAARRTMERYPVGKQVRVYYDPDRPEIAVLQPGGAEGTPILLVGGAVVSVVGMLGYASELRKRRRKKS